jgi:lysyl-tRNA synthetase class 2
MSSENEVAQAREAECSEQAQVRRAKRKKLLESGAQAYPVSVPLTTTIAAVREGYGHLEAGQMTSDEVGVAGRVVFFRDSGKLCFVMLQDGHGRRLQAMISLAEVGADSLAEFKALVDLGDHLFVHGRVIASKRGELSILADSWIIASKALRPLPVLHANLSEEARVRQRSADLIVRPQARSIARARIALVRSLRSSLELRQFVEVETPMLQTVHGGAAARPFSTHMNSLSRDLFLRIAPELFLKRAVVGGLDRVFEINRVFRNEGLDSSHSPEFTMLEAYEAYGDYNTIGQLTREMIQEGAQAAMGGTTVTLADGTEYDFGGNWESISLYGSLSQALGEEISPRTPREHLLELADKLNVAVDQGKALPGKIVERLWEDQVGVDLWAPTFVCDFPTDTSPLTRQHRTEEGVVEKWDLYIRGVETATGYSELVDPVVQRERFEAQAALAAQGDPEAMVLDEEFLQAMEYGMPPSGGMGMGIERLLMAFTGLGIRETQLFPLIKPTQ